jgi:beta-galactosidase/beta-glucuronidase
MMYRYPHVIRLRGFWRGDELREAQQIEAQQSPLRYCRRFGAPTGLDYHERVWLVCEGIAAPATIYVNGEVVGNTATSAADFECDMTSRLQSRNEVCLEFAAAAAGLTPLPQPDEPARAVRLEIRTTLSLP